MLLIITGVSGSGKTVVDTPVEIVEKILGEYRLNKCQTFTDHVWF